MPTIEDSRPFPQEVTLDAMRLPWVFDPHVGVILADWGQGDGAYRWSADQKIVPNPTPTTSQEMQLRVDAMLQRVFRMAAADARPPPSPSSSSSSSSPSPSRPPSPAARPRPRRRANEDADAALSRCTIHRTQRPSPSKRFDMCIVTPDGARFRSKVAALAHMERRGL